jgi:hypothetical protein
MRALRTVYTDLEAWDDRHRAHQARCQLTESVLAHRPQRVDGWVPGFVTAGSQLLDCLGREPAEPTILNYAGVLLYELLELGGAEALFREVQRLQPGEVVGDLVLPQLLGEHARPCDVETGFHVETSSLRSITGTTAARFGPGSRPPGEELRSSSPRSRSGWRPPRREPRLPGGGAVQLTIDADDASPEGGGGSAGEAAFVLHDPVLGAIEVRLALAPGGVQASVKTPSGVLAERAADGLPDLISRLGTATGRPAAATSSVRPPGTPAPTPPQGAVDVHA